MCIWLVKKLKLLAKVLYWVFIALGLITLALNVYNAVIIMVSSDIENLISIMVQDQPNEYVFLMIAVIGFAACFLTANVLEALFNGFAILVEDAAKNTESNEKLVLSNEKVFTALECLNNNVCNLNTKEIKD